MGIEQLRGFPPLEATVKLLLALGHEVNPAHLHNRVRGRAEAEDLPSILESQGLRGRLVQIEPSDYRILDLPTLLQLKEGSWILLHQIAKRHWDIEDALERRLRAPVPEELSGLALERLGLLSRSGSLWLRIGRLLLDHQGPIAQILLVSAIMQILAMASPFITRAVIDQALPQASRSILALAVLGILITSLTASGLGLIRDWTSTFVETRLDAVARRSLLDHMLHLPFYNLMSRTASELMQAFSGLSSARDLLSQRLFGTAMDTVTALGYLVFMVSLWPLGAGLVLVGCFILASLSLGTGFFQTRIQRKTVPAQILERGMMIQMLQGIDTIKSAGQESRILKRWLARFLNVQDLVLRHQRMGLWNEVGLDSLRQILNVTLLVEGGRRVLLGELSIGTLFAFQQMTGSLTGAFQGAANLALSFLVARPQMEKTQEVLSIEPEPPSHPQSIYASLDLVVENVSFRYTSKGPWVLLNLNLKVEAGTCHLLRWPSGAGKSTLLRMLAGLLEPNQGHVTLGGRPAREMRNELAYMPQGFQLYSGTILDNLRILSAQAPIERIMAAADSSGLARLTATLPMGYETHLSHGGGNISGGQRQLILITAAMATERHFLLLDEAFANLDWISRSEILHGNWFQGKTVLYASHDAGISQERTQSETTPRRSIFLPLGSA